MKWAWTVGAHHKLTVERIPRLVWNRLTIVKPQSIQHLDSVCIEVAEATHQGCSFHGQLSQGLLSLCSLVLFYLQQTCSQLLYVGLQGGMHPLKSLWLPTMVMQMLH